MESLERVLREQRFLQDLSPEETALVVSCAKNVRFAKDELLLREGQPADTFYLLRTGRVSLEVHFPERGAVQMETIEPGDVLGLSWLIPPYRVTLDARAVESGVALAFDGACLRGKMESDDHLAATLMKRLLTEAIKRLGRVRLQRLDVYGVG